MAGELFGFNPEEMVGKKMSDLLSVTNKSRPQALMEEHLETSGQVVMVSGHVVSDSWVQMKNGKQILSFQVWPTLNDQ